MNIMGWQAVVLSGREVGGELCAHGGEGAEGMDDP